MDEELKQKLDDLRFNVLRMAIYHSARKSFLDKENKIFSLLVILAGASAVGDLGTMVGLAILNVKVLAFMAAAAGAIQLVFDFGVRAREHDFLQRRYYELLANIAEKIDPTPLDVARWEAQLNRLYSEEPAPMRALDAIAYNAASESLGKHTRIKVRPWHTLLAQWWAFNESEFPYERTGPGPRK